MLRFLSIAICLTLLLMTRPSASAESNAKSWLLEHTRVQALWYMHYLWGENATGPYNRFSITRGYTTFRFTPTAWFEARSTIDLYEDDDGWALRLKYLYGRLRWPLETAIISDPGLEFGLVHTPWFDFEGKVNHYRIVDNFFLDRHGLLQSADLGLQVSGLIGRKLTKEGDYGMRPHHAGTWGSFALGVYNGSGYKRNEANQNKVFMGRLTLRPFGPWMPGLQASYLFVGGKGNVESEPNWLVHDLLLSFEHPFFLVAVQGAKGRGDIAGERIDSQGQALPFLGASAFVELKLPCIHTSLFGQFDWFRWDTETGHERSDRFVVGAAYYFYRACAVVIDFDRERFLEPVSPAAWSTKLSMQVAL